MLLLFLPLFSREALKWLLTAIRKSTEYGKSNETKKGDEQIRLVTKQIRKKFLLLVWSEHINRNGTLPRFNMPYRHGWLFQCLSFPHSSFFLSIAEWCPAFKRCCPWLWRQIVVQLYNRTSCPRKSSICSLTAQFYGNTGENDTTDTDTNTVFSCFSVGWRKIFSDACSLGVCSPLCVCVRMCRCVCTCNWGGTEVKL